MLDLSALSLEEVDSVSEIGALAAAQQNWSHSTASTSLTAGGGSGGVKATPVGMGNQPQQAPPPPPPTQAMAAPVSASAAAQFGASLPSGVLKAAASAQPGSNGFRFSNSHGLMDMPLQQSMFFAMIRMPPSRHTLI